MSRLNYGIITLLPKVKEADRIQQYRPICLLNFLHKLITKVLTLRLDHVMHKLILQTQTAFMKGRNIMTGVLALHEIMHETKRKGEICVILKLDFEKAYDKVCWDFLFENLKHRNFSERMQNWINKVLNLWTCNVR